MTPEQRAQARENADVYCDNHLAGMLTAALDALDAAERERDRYRFGAIEIVSRERDTARALVATLAEALRWYAHADKFALHSSEHPQDRARAALRAAGVET